MIRAWLRALLLLYPAAALAAPAIEAPRTLTLPPALEAAAPLSGAAAAPETSAPAAPVPQRPGARLFAPVALPAAGPAGRFVVSPKNLTVGHFLERNDPKAFEQLKAIADPKARLQAWLERSAIEAFDLTRGASGRKLTREQAKALEDRTPELLKAHLARTLAEHEHEVFEKDGVRSYRLGDALPFWVDFVTPEDPETRAAAVAFVQTNVRKRVDRGPAYQIVASLTDGPTAVTRLVDLAQWGRSGAAALERLARSRGLSLASYGRYAVVGSGLSFYLTREVLGAAAKLEDPELARSFGRILRFLARGGTPLIFEDYAGAAAFFSPVSGRLAYAMPSRAGLNTLSHEATHARFYRFQDTLLRWLGRRKRPIPYEIDGPRAGVFGLGGYFTLLNELNSWRAGNAFDGPVDDAAILATLRERYGREAGAGATAQFESLWPPSRIAGKSVPRLILESARAQTGPAAPQAAPAPAADDPGLEAGFDELWRAFAAHPSYPLRARLAGAAGFDGPHLAELARWALAPDVPADLQAQAAQLLPDALDAAGLPVILSETSLKSAQAMQRSYNENNGAAPEAYLPQARPDQPGRVPPELDRALAELLFNGQTKIFQINAIAAISQRTYPDEMPFLKQRLLAAALAPEASDKDRLTALLFLVPAKAFFRAHIAWGQLLADAILAEPRVGGSAREFVGEFYRLGVGPSFGGPSFGAFEGALDADARRVADAHLLLMSASEKARLDRVLSDLWRLMGDSDPKVAKAAVYAAAASPILVAGLEARLAQALRSPPSPRHASAARLAALLQPGFSPALDALTGETLNGDNP